MSNFSRILKCLHIQIKMLKYTIHYISQRCKLQMILLLNILLAHESH